MTDCRRYIIAKRAVFNLLDDNRDGKIDSSDETSLGVRVGYVAYYLDLDFVTEVTGLRRGIGTPYADLYCNSNGNGTACTKTKEDSAVRHHGRSRPAPRAFTARGPVPTPP